MHSRLVVTKCHRRRLVLKCVNLDGFRNAREILTTGVRAPETSSMCKVARHLFPSDDALKDMDAAEAVFRALELRPYSPHIDSFH